MTLDKEPGCDITLDLATDELPDLSEIDICVSNAAITDTIAAGRTGCRRSSGSGTSTST